MHVNTYMHIDTILYIQFVLMDLHVYAHTPLYTGEAMNTSKQANQVIGFLHKISTFLDQQLQQARAQVLVPFGPSFIQIARGTA